MKRPRSVTPSPRAGSMENVDESFWIGKQFEDEHVPSAAADGLSHRGTGSAAVDAGETRKHRAR